MISVIIPAYNSSATIINCIRSVIDQTREDLISEIIVIDDGSTDNTVDVIKNSIADERVKIIRKPNGGVSSARNAGINISCNEWIALLDSDDVWLPEKIERQIEMIHKHPEIKFIGCNRNNEHIKIGTKVSDDLYYLQLKNILFKTWPHTSTAIIHRSVLEKVGIYNESFKYCEDGELWNRIATLFPLYYIPESLEIAGGGKRQFGESGLSANIKEMHKGVLRNNRILFQNNKIGLFLFLTLDLIEKIKYLRRILIKKSERF